MSLASFWDSPPDRNRRRVIKAAIAITMWKCPDDGTNLNTRDLPANTTEVRCTHCGQTLSLVRVSYPGMKS